MKRHLILVRHAQSRPAEPGQRDIERELTDSGLRDASRLGRYLYVKKAIPDKILTSHALRATQTAQYIAEQLRLEYAQVKETEDLYEASVRTLLGTIAGLDPSIYSVLIIGHNPAISHLCEHLSEEELGSMSSGSMIRLSFANLNWDELSKGTGIIIDNKSPDQIII